MPSVFLSYAYPDQQIARQLADDLQAQGVQVWFDQREILAGDSIVERIRDGIRSVDYLIVLLSESSTQSVWVEREIGSAIARFGEDASSAILPVRLDASVLPRNFEDIRYVDLTAGYEQAVDELISRIRRDERPRVSLNSVVDTEELADDIAAERQVPRGPEFYVTTVIAILSIVVTLIAAWPSFQTAFARVPKVYFDVRSETVSLPPGANKAQVMTALKAAGVAPAGLRIRVINKGQAPASKVKIGITTDGALLYAKTEPRLTQKVVWVEIAVDSFTAGDKEAVVQLTDLVPEKPIVIDLGYEPSGADHTTDVVAAGMLAQKVSDIDLVPSWSFWKALEFPLRLLATGLGLSVLVGIILAARRNPRLRDKLLDLLNALFPFIGRLLKTITG